MAVLKFLAVAVAAICLSENNWVFGDTPPNGGADGGGRQVNSGKNCADPGGGSGSDPGGSVEHEDTEDGGGVSNSAAREDCWKQMNEARSLVGFTGFQQQDMLKITVAEAKAASGTAEEVKQYLKQVCDAVKTVDYWKEAFTNFNRELPPAYAANTRPYDIPRNISFISLFNPHESPKVDCAYFTCPKSAAGGGTKRRIAGTKGAVKALPNALTKGKKPYEQEQWDKIAAGLKSGSAVAAAPTAVALVAAAVATLLL
ncbi:SAG family member [Eimeria brunetti]|uniref:SAG family member n=1 Tax=Eimeria brunetti TaxID=51314 RepID=U6LMK6_9EIME|nr:SAG family member [Eimeria brunetti]